MKVLFAASECSPIVKVGGLADVVGSLPKALKGLGVDVSVVIPLYESIKNRENLNLIAKEIPIFFDGKKQTFSVWQGFLPQSEVPVYFIDKPEYFFDGVYIEPDASSGGSETEAKRFLFLSLAVIEITRLLELRPDILHCQDWHTAIVASLLKLRAQGSGLRAIKTVLTIHNLGYRGIYPSEIVNRLLGTNLKEKEVNCLKEGILNADFINTVSPNYAKEILRPEYGFGLEEALKKREKEGKLIGILNGLDTESFNPETDSYIKSNYSSETLEKKEENKIFLQEKCFQKADPKIPVLGMVSRLAEQKGFDLIIEIFSELMKENLQFILLAQGKKEYEDFFKDRAKEFSPKFWVKIGFDPELARQIYAGVDIFLMPSFFEPCGLGQMIAMRYGTVPLARETGGIKGTVTKETGFLFKKYDAKELQKTIKKALEIYQNKKIWRCLQINGMRQDFSWNQSAKKYLEIYQTLKNK